MLDHVASDDAPLEVFLQPGDLYFGEGRTRVRTLLGSCVAIAVWHPRLRIGGLCHYMLPSRGGPGLLAPGELDGRYGDEAMRRFAQEMRQANTTPDQYVAKLFGGGHMFGATVQPDQECRDVPCKNVQIARELARAYGMVIKAEHLGGRGHRNLLFEIWSGDAYLRFWGHDAEQRQTA